MKQLVALVVLFVGLGISAHAQTLTDRQVHDTLKQHNDALKNQADSINNGLKPRLKAAEDEISRLKTASTSGQHDVTARQEGLLNIELYFVAVRGYDPDRAQAEAARIVTGNLSKGARRQLLIEAAAWYKNAGPIQLIEGVERAMKARFSTVEGRVTGVETRLGTVETTLVAYGTRIGAVEGELKTLREGLEKTVDDAVAKKLVGYYTREESNKAVTDAISTALAHALENGLVTEADMAAFVDGALKGYASSKEVTVIRDSVIALIRMNVELTPHQKLRNISGSHDAFRRQRVRALIEIENALKAAQAADEAEAELAPKAPLAAPSEEPEEEATECPTPDDEEEKPPVFVE